MSDTIYATFEDTFSVIFWTIFTKQLETHSSFALK